MLKLISKWNISSKTDYTYPEGTGSVTMYPVYESGQDGNAVLENRIFGEATPSGSLNMSIMNPTAFGFIKTWQSQKKPLYVIVTDEEPAELQAIIDSVKARLAAQTGKK